MDPDVIDAAMKESTPTDKAPPATALATVVDRPERPAEIPIIGGKIAPSQFGQLPRIAAWIQKSGLVPDSLCKNAQTEIEIQGRVMIVIAAGLAVGMDPMQSLKNVMMVNNLPSLWGDAIPGLVYASGKIDGVFEESWDGLSKEGTATESTVAICRATRKGSSVPTERRYSAADAKAQKLWNKSGPWSNSPKRMLQIRARAWLARDLFPDVLGGLGIVEEESEVRPSGSAVNELNGKIAALPQTE